MKLTFLGTDSGTEPVFLRRHMAFTIETGGYIYWFDAGEGCSHTAYTHGMNLSLVRRVIISHSHMDHFGGLGNLLWNIRKVDNVYHSRNALPVDIHVPEMEPLDALMALLRYTEGDFACKFPIQRHLFDDGEVFADENMRVTALHNHHLPDRADGRHRAYGFLIECEGKRIIYTGDTGGVDDYAPLFPCDVLITETGHHTADSVAAELTRKGLIPADRLIFTHHGVQILADFDGELAKAQAAMPGKVIFVNDSDEMTIEGAEISLFRNDPWSLPKNPAPTPQLPKK